ncbi:vitelline membrane protein Vm26Ab [Streptomyces albireticuli]|uniref:Vitelline membrane protein Vm26Ab n=1 Tax=Streptomyces albireticuli TaxID=1940 RepID=A0A1Z2KUL2_9ACTN|nr:RDD family protein [Streptomyces albireticuli]ARZ65710.1 vitelline membrane protein Vm26Ab [Streptomyces albireticuli]
MPKSRRVIAWFIDFALVVAAAALLAVFTFQRISGLLTDVPELAAGGSWQFLTSQGDVTVAAQGLGESLWRKAVGYVQQAFVLLAVVTFLYQWACLSFAGRTLGKALTGLRVTPRTPRRAALRAAVTTSADVALYAVACCLLVEGLFFLSVVCWAAAVALFLLNALPVVTPSRRSLADRVAGTSVAGVTLPRLARPSW